MAFLRILGGKDDHTVLLLDFAFGEEPQYASSDLYSRLS